MEERDELELHNCEDCCDGDCDCNHEIEPERFSVTDEDGIEHHFEIIYELENDGKFYWITQEFFEGEDGEPIEDENESEYVVFRAEYSEDDDPVLHSVEDEEFEKVSVAWNKIVEEMLAQADDTEEEE